MDYIKHDGEIIEMVIEDARQPLCELSEIQLALIGGGCGETVFH